MRRAGHSWPAAWPSCRSRWAAGCWSCTAKPATVIPRLAPRDRRERRACVGRLRPLRPTPRRAGRESPARPRTSSWVTTGSPYAVAPGRVRKPDGTPYAVFTPYFRGWTAHGWRRAGRLRRRRRAGSIPADVEAADAPMIRPISAGRSPAGWSLPEPGEAAAQQRWREFLDQAVDGYDDDRDRPDHPGTSRMSPYLKWGCIHPRTLLADLATQPLRRVPRPTGASWPGGSSTPTSCSTGRIGLDVGGSGDRPAALGQRVRRPTTGWRPGRPGRPATPTSTPGCGSCWPRAGCTTGSGWGSRPS